MSVLRLRGVARWAAASFVGVAVMGSVPGCRNGEEQRDAGPNRPAVNSATDSTFDEFVITHSRERPVIVMFWAPWSGPDRVLKPVVSRAVRGREGRIQLTFVNVDESPKTAERYRIRAIPTLVPFVDEDPVLRRSVGAIPRARLELYLDEILEASD